MGACNFSITTYGKNVNDAYERAVKDSIKYCGDDPYNGTISTTSGVRLKKDHPKYGTKAYYEWEEKRLDDLNKRGVCEAVELTGVTAKRMKESFGVKGKKGIKIFYMFGWAAE